MARNEGNEIMRLRERQTERALARVAFTLMEVLVVVAIIVALAGLGGFMLMQQLSTSQAQTARLQAIELTKAVEAYAIAHGGQYPPSLQVLLQQDQNGNGPYIKKASMLMDPWGQQYQYNMQGVQNSQHGNNQPDVYTVSPKTGQMIGNW